MEMLRHGGNAFDAAVAVSSVLSVVEPISSGLGGGGFFLLHDAKTGKDIFIDARETAPAAATQAEYLDAKGGFNRDRGLTAAISSVTAANRASMLQDMLAGRPTEIDAITGVLLRMAETSGLDLPTHRAVYTLIRTLEAATR